MLSSIVDLVDSADVTTRMPAVLLNIRNGAAGFLSLLDEVILDRAIDDVEDVEDINENGK